MDAISVFWFRSKFTSHSNQRRKTKRKTFSVQQMGYEREQSVARGHSLSWRKGWPHGCPVHKLSARIIGVQSAMSCPQPILSKQPKPVSQLMSRTVESFSHATSNLNQCKPKLMAQLINVMHCRIFRSCKFLPKPVVKLITRTVESFSYASFWVCVCIGSI